MMHVHTQEVHDCSAWIRTTTLRKSLLPLDPVVFTSKPGAACRHKNRELATCGLKRQSIDLSVAYMPLSSYT
jgi:hypothetical protein